MRIPLLIICCMLFMNLQAKIVIEEQILEPAIVEVLYKRIKVTDTLFVDADFKTDFLTLRAGKSTSVFYSAERKTYDSISTKNFEYVIALMKDSKAFNEASKFEWEVLFKNFPTGKITNHTRHSLCSWIYEEDWEKPSWEITDSNLLSEVMSVCLPFPIIEAVVGMLGLHQR